MPKNIPSPAYDKLQQTHGTEPKIEIEICWSGTTFTVYNDSILEVGDIDSIVNVNTDGSTSELSVKLSDIDGSLKTLFNTIDIHKRPAKVWQTYPDIAERFLVMNGEVASPIVWNEGDRTLSFTILTKIEEKEIGFSPEEGRLNIPPELSSKAWPLCFGKVVNVPAVKISQVVRGTLRQAIGIPDPSLPAKYYALTQQATILQAQVAYFLSAQMLSSTIADGAQLILERYINVIITQANYVREFFELQFQLAVAQRNMALWNNPNQRNPFHVIIQNIEQSMLILIGQSNDNLLDKQGIEAEIRNSSTKSQMVQDILSKLASVFDEQRRVALDISKIIEMMNEQATYDVSSFAVNQGEKFPQNTPVDILINGVRINGSFSGNNFQVGAVLPAYTNVQMDSRQNNDPDKLWIQDGTMQLKGMYALVQTNRNNMKKVIKLSEQVGNQITFELKDYQAPAEQLPQQPEMPEIREVHPSILATLDANNALPLASQDEQNIIELQTNIQAEANYGPELALALSNIAAFLQPRYEIEGTEIIQILAVSGTPLAEWYEGSSVEDMANQSDLSFWYADSGAEVRLAYDKKEIFVANILESDVVVVQAKKNGRLTPVPEGYYEVSTANLSTIHPCIITMNLPLNEIEGEGWEDQIYVCLESSVGPTVVAVLKWAIETYTDDTWDATSFAYVATKTSKLRANFCTFDRTPVNQFLKEVAMQAMCSIWNDDGVYYVKYLPEEDPTAVETLTESDVMLQSLQVSLTPTEDLVTKVVGTWQSDYSLSDHNRMILRHNVKKYGIVERSIDFYIYSDQAQVERAATFWMIRWCNTWKKLTCSVSLRKLKLNTLDTVLLDFTNSYVATGAIKALVEKATYSPNNYQIDLELWVPVRAGEMTQYLFAWPENIDITVEFPPPEDIEDGNAGGGGPGSGASGSIGQIGDITSRPGDLGSQFMAGDAQGDPADPLSGFGLAGNGNFQNLNPFQLRVLQALNALINGQFAFLPGNREVMMGTIVEIPDPTVNAFTVALQDGSKLFNVVQYKFDSTQLPKVGDAVYVVRGNNPVTFYMQAPTFKPIIKEVEVVEIFDDWIKCEDVEGLEIWVAKPFELRRSTYDGSTVGDELIKHISHNKRGFYRESVDENDEVEHKLLWEENMYPPYYPREVSDDPDQEDTPGNKIYAGYIEESAVPAGPDAQGIGPVNNIKWIDINADGRSWNRDACDWMLLTVPENSNLPNSEFISSNCGGKVEPNWGGDRTDPEIVDNFLIAWGPPGSPKPTELPEFIYNQNNVWLHNDPGSNYPFFNQMMLKRITYSEDEELPQQTEWVIEGNQSDFELVELSNTLSYEGEADAYILDDDFQRITEPSGEDSVYPMLKVKDAFLKDGDSMPSGTRLGVHRRGGIWWVLAGKCN